MIYATPPVSQSRFSGGATAHLLRRVAVSMCLRSHLVCIVVPQLPNVYSVFKLLKNGREISCGYVSFVVG